MFLSICTQPKNLNQGRYIQDINLFLSLLDVNCNSLTLDHHTHHNLLLSLDLALPILLSSDRIQIHPDHMVHMQVYLFLKLLLFLLSLLVVELNQHPLKDLL